MWFDLAIFMGVPAAVAILAVAFGVDTRDGDDWVVHPR
jgi:hypothetical protein